MLTGKSWPLWRQEQWSTGTQSPPAAKNPVITLSALSAGGGELYHLQGRGPHMGCSGCCRDPAGLWRGGLSSSGKPQAYPQAS